MKLLPSRVGIITGVATFIFQALLYLLVGTATDWTVITISSLLTGLTAFLLVKSSQN